MSLYGDKLTLANAAGSDNLAKTSAAPRDNLDFTEGSGGDDTLTLVDGEDQRRDNLAAVSGPGEDNLAKQSYTLTTEVDTLSTSSIEVDVEDTGEFPASGNATVYRRSDGAEQQFSYTNKSASQLRDCTIAIGTFIFNIGDMIETA